MLRSKAPLGLLGGTFDPIHFGHLRLAQAARTALGLAAVRLIPAGTPPHRDAPVASAAQRLEMARLAAATCPGLEVDASEVFAPSKSYTVVTLERLRAELGPDQPLVWLVGMDAFFGLPSWYQWHRLFELAHIAVANRPGYPLVPDQMAEALATEFRTRAAPAPALAAQPAGHIVTFEMPPLAISATDIRRTLATGGSAHDLCPDPVLAYIASQRLYGSA